MRSWMCFRSRFQGEVPKWLHGVAEMFNEVEPVVSCQEDMFVLTDIGNLVRIDIMTLLMGICVVI